MGKPSKIFFLLYYFLLLIKKIFFIDEISYHRTNLLEDVAEDFKSISLVKSKFTSWKTEFNDDYTKAYGGLSLPGVFEFYIRYEIMLWNTLKV
jgi:hypothetical protein